MDKHKDDGGFAFPGHEHFVGKDKVITGKPYGGMTLRDYFAAKALTGIIAGWGDAQFNPPAMVAKAYLIADTMLSERNKHAND